MNTSVATSCESACTTLMELKVSHQREGSSAAIYSPNFPAPFGRRGWREWYARLRGLVLYLGRDDSDKKRSRYYTSSIITFPRLFTNTRQDTRCSTTRFFCITRSPSRLLTTRRSSTYSDCAQLIWESSCSRRRELPLWSEASVSSDCSISHTAEARQR